MTTPDDSAPDTPLQGFEAVGFFPADYAAAENGKVYASGAYWNRLRFPQFPAVLPAMSLVAVLRQPFHASHADHTIEMSLQDMDGNVLPSISVSGEFRANLGPDDKFGDAGLLPFAVPLHGVGIEQAGDYTFVLTVDGKELARYPFRAVQTVR